MPRISTIPARQVPEDIHSYEHLIGKRVLVLVCPGQMVGDTFVFDVPQTFEKIEIAGADYAELMAAAPVWAPTKMAGCFLPADLWYFVDLIRARAEA